MTRFWCFLAISCLLVFPSGAGAQVASLVADLNSSGVSFDPGGEPRSFVGFRGKAVFIAVTVDAGGELWVTDGTASGTEMLADTCPGSCSINAGPPAPLGGALVVASQSTPCGLWRTDATRAGTVRLTPPELTIGASFARLEDELFFTGCTPALGCEPWVSDGTAAGTRLVRDVVPGPGSSDARDFETLGDEVYFFTGPSSRVELWASDGTAGGTRRVAQLLGASARFLTAAGDRLFLVLNRSGNQAIWTSDGTQAGTASLVTFVISSLFSFVPTSWLKPVGDRIFFVASDAHGSELWTSDGTVAGTRRITDFAEELPFGGLYLFPDQLVVLGGRLLFTAGPTDPGAERLSLWAMTAEPGSARRLSDAIVESNLQPFGGRVYFAATEGAHGRELWTSDGTAAGTVRVTDLCPGTCDGVVVSPGARSLQTLLGRLFFRARATPQQQVEIWSSDGTAAGTRAFTDLPPGINLSFDALGEVGSRLLFVAGDGFERELWVSDGAPGGTRLVREIGHDAPDSSPSNLVAAGDRLFFRACDGERRDIWQSSGSAPPARLGLSADCHVGTFPPQDLVTASGLVFFWHVDENGLRQLWRSDGTAGGTVQLTFLTTNAGPWSGGFLVGLGDEVFFPVVVFEEDRPKEEVWRSDGTPQGTGLAFELPDSAVPLLPTSAGEALYFPVLYVNTSPFTTEIWRSDGTQAGTERLTPPKFIPHTGASFTSAGSAVYFLVAEPPPSPVELWKADSAGAVKVAAFEALPVALAELHGLLYFLLRGASAWELWRYDGTADGTVRIDTFPDSQPVSELPQVAVAGGRLFIFAREPETSGLWVSDGTPGSLRRLVESAPPQFGGATTHTAVGDRLFFVGHDPVHGMELWTSDGTEGGTRLVHDIAPGGESSHPFELTDAGTKLYFSADDGVHGRELWVLDLAQPAGVCVPSGTALCLGGRFRVEAAWRDFAGNRGAGRTVPLTADTGAFWFFGPENVEVFLKVLDGRGLNQHHWVFYGALSSVEYALTVTDVQTGITSRYWNPSGQLASVADTTGFGPLGAFSVVERSTSGPPPRTRSERVPAAAAVPCVPAPTRLCLRDGRFAVEATWKDFSGNTGIGTAVALTGDTGYFWFFGADNVEVVLKVLDGRPLNGKHWVFYGALSSVEYTLRVTDTATGKVKTYKNESGNLASVADTGAF